ncbi:MAG TPA: alpha-L-arabinofuranosidase C-terminal domain-containing protein [Planctomycetota bacterium]|nr:alpha-L-arabinofuranosidase C-terminal domain-containing protein [Planctomycetota bacterium]
MAYSPSGTAGQAARIEVDAAQCGPPISRWLFGKFTEHLGSNVYQGAWAQIVVNPEFAPATRWAKADALHNRLLHDGHTLDGMAAADFSQFAPFWMPVGNVRGELLCDGERDVQRLAPAQENAGLRTGVFLPLHRERTFELTLKARVRQQDADKQKAELGVVIRTADGKAIASRKITLAAEWKESKANVTIPKAVAATPGELFLLDLLPDAGSIVDVSRVLLFPADNLSGWDPDVVAYMKDARLPLLRFPGGNFASSYHWRDGVGPLDSRPVLPNRDWPDVIEFNHVGTDEWLKLCELTGAEPMICVNAGSGTPDEARDWLLYCNAPADTPMGQLRAANGRRKPHNVRIWEIGNEIYGHWQTGCTDAAGYAERHVRFHDEMRMVAGPDVLFITCGFDEAWNDALVKRGGATVRSISQHYLIGWAVPQDADPAEVFRKLMAWSATLDHEMQKAWRPMEAAGLPPKLAITELQVFTRHRTVPNNQTLAEALWTADVINASILSRGKVELITHSALLNHGGGLRKKKGVVYPNPVWWTTHIYGTQDGIIPVAVNVQSAGFSVPEKWGIPAAEAQVLGAAALLGQSHDSLTTFVVNRDPERAIEAEISIEGFISNRKAEIVTLAGDTFMAVNTLDCPDCVQPTAAKASAPGGTMRHTFPAASLTRITLRK